MTAVDTALVVEDDAPMRRYLRTALAGHGLRVVEAGNLAEARRLAVQAVPTLALVDLGLPDGDGVELVQEIRRWSRMPIVVLSARGREDDKVGALDAGADDYLTKPFGVGELLARVRVALRHARGAPDDAVLAIGPIRIDPARHDVTVDGAAVHLTPIEYRLLALLARNAGRLCSHRELLREVWGPNAVRRTHYLRVHMQALRRKIEAEPARPRWLVTEPGVGYRLRDA